MSRRPARSRPARLAILLAATLLSPLGHSDETTPTPPANAPPRPLHIVRPEYPKAALADDIEGWVDVEFTIAEDGTTHDVVVIEADPPRVFERAALRAVVRWTYEPERRNGHAVASRVRQHIVFQP